MLKRKTYKYRIYPTQEQIETIDRNQKVLCSLWNLLQKKQLLYINRNSLCQEIVKDKLGKSQYLLISNKKNNRKYSKLLTKILLDYKKDNSSEITELRECSKYYKDCYCSLQHALAKIHAEAWKRYFKKISGKPKFKKYSKNWAMMRWRQNTLFKIKKSHPKSGRITIGGLGIVKARIHRKIEDESTPKNLTLTKDGDCWFVSIQTEIETNVISHNKPNTVVGIDRNVVNYCADSNGNIKNKPAFMSDKGYLNKEIKSLQKELSRKQGPDKRTKSKGSKNWHKQLDKINRKKRKLRNKTNHFIHGLSKQYTDNNETIVIEKLQQQNKMTKSAKGTLGKPGKNVKQKSGLNRNIQRMNWYKFKEQLDYKSDWKGGTIEEVNPSYTSITCSSCGYCSKENRKKQSQFKCIDCGFEKNADINAAINIKNRSEKNADINAAINIKNRTAIKS